MKRLFFLIPVFIFASTYYVDKNPSCSLFFCTVCDGTSVLFSQITDTIKDAVDTSSSGDTIKVCPDKYNESYIKIDKNLVIESTTNNPDDVIVYDDSGSEIFVYSGWRDGCVLSGLTVKQESDISAVYIDTGTDYEFSDLKIISKGDGIRAEGGSFQNSTFSNLEVNSSSNAIVLKNPSDFTLEKSLIYATNYSFYTSSPQGKLDFIEDEFHSDNTAFYLGDASQNYTVEGCKFYTKNSSAGAINLDKASNLKVTYSYFNSNGKGSGIWINGTINNDVNISDNYFENMKYESIYFKLIQGNTYINDNYIDNSSYGIRIKDTSNGKEILNNIIENSTSYGLWLLDDFKWRSFNVYYNCFINNENQANSRDKNAHFDDGSVGNYWSDAPGAKKYEVPDVPKYDNFPQSDCVLPYTAYIDYHMDECDWDDNGSTYEIKNFGSEGDDYNATAQNGADTVADSIICRAGNIINDYYLTPKNAIPLSDKYTINMWLKFPLNDNAHNDDNGYKFFNIADRDGSDKDFIYITLTPSGNLVWNVGYGVYNNEFPDDLNGWHMLSFVVDGNSTKLYIDGKYENKIDYAITDDNLSILFNSDYDTGDGPYGQSIGGIVDEFKIFDRVLSLSDIMRIYLKEKEGYDYKGQSRTCNICNPPVPLAEWRMDECAWDNDSSTYEIKDYVNDYNATSVNGADVTVGKVCSGGDLNGSGSENNKYIELKNYPELSDTWSLVEWIKFPLNSDNHLEEGGKYYFVIATVEGTGDLAYFAKDTSNGDFYFGVYDNNENTKESKIDEPSGGWHHIGVVSNGSQTILYIDAEEITRVDTYTKGNLKYIGTSTDNSDKKTIGSVIDEVKIYDGILSGGDIYDIYHDEDNSNRVCPNCEMNYMFDARDVYRDYNDTNISIKIVNKEFNLTIASYDENKTNLQEFNGTVCVQIIDNNDVNLTPWVKMSEFLNDVNESNWTNIKINMARKVAKVKIEWKQNVDESCPLSSDYNDTNSSDNFAIRPLKFEVSMSNLITAAEEFDFNVSAKDYLNNSAKDYNQSDVNVSWEFNDSRNCNDIEFNITGVDFNDGESNNSARIDDVGEINISVVDSRFDIANGAAEECNASNECVEIFGNGGVDGNNVYCCNIEGNISNIKIIPHHFELNIYVLNFDENFTYIDSNNTHIYSLIDYNISAKNKANQTTKNYNKECYAKNIDTNLSYGFYVGSVEVERNLSDLNYIYTNADVNVSSSVEVKNPIFLTLSKNNFTTDNNGSAEIKIFVNFDKNISNPVSPFEFNITDVNISDGDVERNVTNIEGNALFYYGNIITKDLATAQDSVEVNATFVVFDENETNLTPSDAKEVSVDWFENLYHNNKDGNISSDEVKISDSYEYNSSNIQSGVSVDSVSVNNQTLSISVTRSDNNVKFAVLHLISPNLEHLWYSKFNQEYNISDGSSCLNHFCISVTWKNTNEAGDVGSGDFNGTKSNVTEYNSTNTGVKIFR